VFDVSVHVPSVVLPKVNFTVPVAAGLAVSVAVKLTASPYSDEVGLAVTLIVSLTPLTVSVVTGEVEPARSAVPP
jgi:hypothetical protein